MVQAVRQWPGNEADLDFRSVVRSARGFILTAVHMQEVADAGNQAVFGGVLPDIIFQMCAFFRIWCVVELAAALQFSKPVVMLVGAADDHGQFVADNRMLTQLSLLIDVSKARASHEADRVRILNEVRTSPGFEPINQMCAAAAGCAGTCMKLPAVLRAALGNMGALAGLSEEERGDAMVAAAGGGYHEVVMAMLQAGTPVDLIPPAQPSGMSALMAASVSGHLTIMQLLLDANADINLPCEARAKSNEGGSAGGYTALHAAVQGGGLVATRMLLDRGADVHAKGGNGMDVLMAAASDGNVEVCQLLLDHGANAQTSLEGDPSMTGLTLAAASGYVSVVELLLRNGAAENRAALSAAKRYARQFNHHGVQRSLAAIN